MKFRNRVFIVLLVFFLIAVAAGVQWGMGTVFSSIKSYVETNLESSLQEQISYEMLLFRNINTLGARNVAVSPSLGEKKSLAEVRNILVKYRIFPLLFGKPEKALKTIHVQQVPIEVTPDTIKELKDRLTGVILSAVEEAGGFSSSEFTVKGSDIMIKLYLDKELLAVQDINFTLKVSPDSRYLQGEAYIHYASESGGDPLLSARITYSITVDENLSDGWGEIIVNELEVGPLRFALQRYAVAIKEGVLQVVKTSSSLPTLSLEAHYDAGNFGMSVGMNQLDLRDLILGSSQPWIVDLLAEGYSVNGSLQVEGDPEAISYRMDAQAMGEASGLEISLTGDQREMIIQHISLQNSSGEARFHGTLDPLVGIPEGKVTMSHFRVGDGILPSLDGSLFLEPYQQGVQVSTDSLKIEHATITDLSAQLLPQEGAWSLQLFSRLEEGSLDGQMFFSGSLTSFNFSLRQMPLYIFNQIIPRLPEEISSFLPQNISVNAQAKGLLLQSAPAQFTFHVSVQEKQEGMILPLGTIEARSSPTEPISVWIDTRIQDMAVKVALEIDRENPWQFYGTLAAGLSQFYVQGIELSARKKKIEIGISGSIPLVEVAIDTSDAVKFHAELHADRLDIPLFSSRNMKLTTDMVLDYSQKFWEFKIDELAIDMDKLHLELAGTADSKQGGEFSPVVFADQYSVLIGKVTVQMDQGQFLRAALQLDDNDQSEKIEFEFLWEKGLQAFLEVKNLIAARTGLLNTGFIDLSLQVKDILTAMEVAAHISYRRDPQSAVAFQSKVHWTEEELRLTDLKGSYFAHTIDAPIIRISAVDHQIRGNILYENTSENFRTLLEIRGNMDPDVSQVLPAFQSPFSVTTKITEYREDDRKELGLFQLERGQEFISLSGDNSLSSMIYRIDTGNFRLHINEPSYGSLRAQGYLRSDYIDAEVSVDYFLVYPFAPLSALGWVDFYEGIVSGKLKISNESGSVQVTGELIGRELRATTVFSPTPLGPADLRFAFHGNRMEILKVAIPNGDGMGTLEASFGFSKETLGKFSLTIVSTDPLGLHIKYPFGPVSAEGYASGLVRVESDGRQILVSGDITTRYTTFSFEQGNPFLAIDVLDMRVTSDRAVSFVWPHASRPIIQWVAFPDQQIHITMDQNVDEFNVAGKVDFRSGDIYYFNRLFTLYSGNINFGTLGVEFDPRISVRAELNTSGISGEVSIYLIAENQRLSEFSPRFESYPPLPIAEIVQTLGSNLVEGGKLSGYYQLSDALVTAVSYSRGLSALRDFETSIRTAFRLDVLSVRSEIAQNIVRSVLTNAALAERVENYTFADYLNNTSLTIGRYIGGRDIFLEFRLKLSAELDPFASITNLKPDASFRMEWNTPFFLLEWFFFPRDVQSMFIEDHGVSLSWEASF